MAFPFNAFLSYRSRTDYERARWVESFLEGIHKAVGAVGQKIAPLQICRDGSDFRLPVRRDGGNNAPDVWPIILQELERSEHLLVLCSPGAVESPWVSSEITWFLQNRPGKILLAVTEATDPIGNPSECFPEAIRSAKLHSTTVWYDLRGRERPRRRGRGIKDWEDEIVRLASDLLGWDVGSNGPLWAIYQRQQLKLRRRQAVAISVAAGVAIVLAASAGWFAYQSNVEAKFARANAIVGQAGAQNDPLVATLLLTELADRDPQGGVAEARLRAAQVLPVSELRGPRAGVVDLAFVSGGQNIVAVASDGNLFLWKPDGRGDPVESKHGAGGRTVGLAVRTPDGRSALEVAAAGESRAVVWTPSTGAVLSYGIEGTSKTISYLDGISRFAVVTFEGKVWVLEPNGLVRLAFADGPKVQALFSPQGGGILMAAENGDLWTQKDLESAPSKLKGLPARAEADLFSHVPHYPVFSPDGNWFAQSYDNRLLVRSTSLPIRYLLIDHGAPISTIRFSGDSARVAVGGESGKVAILETATGKQVDMFETNLRCWITTTGRPNSREEYRNNVRQMAFDPQDHDRLAVLSDDLVVRVWRAGKTEPLELRGGFADRLVWSPDSRFVATGADVGTVRVWPVRAPDEPKILPHPAAVDAGFFLADGRILSLARDKVVRVWSLETGVTSDLPKKASATALTVDPHRSRAFVGFEDGWVRQASGAPLAWTGTGKPLDKPIKHMAVGGSQVLAVAEDRAAILDMKAGRSVRLHELDDASVWSVQATEAGDEFLTSDDKGRVLLWSETGEGWKSRTLHPADGQAAFEVGFSPDGKQVVSCSQNGSAFLYSRSSDWEPTRVPIPSDGKWLEKCSFSPDGRFLFVASETGQAWLMDSDGRNVGLLRQDSGLAHIGSIMSASFNSNASQLLLVGGVDGKATLWDVPSRRLLSVLSGNGGAVTMGGISQDGALVLTATEGDGAVRVWRNGWSALVRHLRSRTTATLNPEQRIVLLGESERDAWAAYAAAEKQFNRSGKAAGPFLFPF
jgi:WD40 repeat protein